MTQPRTGTRSGSHLSNTKFLEQNLTKPNHRAEVPITIDEIAIWDLL
jgi:hypothetical protein